MTNSDKEISLFEFKKKNVSNLRDKDGKFMECLSLQLSEIEMLQSIYCGDGEFKIDNRFVELATDHIQNPESDLPPIFNFTISVSVDDDKLEICVCLPYFYPLVKPDISICSRQLSRAQYVNLLNNMEQYIYTLTGESCIYSIVTWLQENVSKYSSKETNNSETNAVFLRSRKFTRYWIYSHHIYNKEKRKHISNVARDYNISGFCLPGKPGVICIEGWADDCSQWWQTIRSMSWKKIACKDIEEIEVQSNDKCDYLRRFVGFDEINFNAKQTRFETHMDMGKFYLYLESHNCAYVFKDIFGFEGKHSSH